MWKTNFSFCLAERFTPARGQQAASWNHSQHAGAHYGQAEFHHEQARGATTRASKSAPQKSANSRKKGRNGDINSHSIHFVIFVSWTNLCLINNRVVIWKTSLFYSRTEIWRLCDFFFFFFFLIWDGSKSLFSLFTLQVPKIAVYINGRKQRFLLLRDTWCASLKDTRSLRKTTALSVLRLSQKHWGPVHGKV